MKTRKRAIVIAELILAMLAAFFMFQFFKDEDKQKRVAVIIENSGDSKWNSFIRGMKASAKDHNIHLVIGNTDEIRDASEEKMLIDEQLDNDIDGFIVEAAPGHDTKEMLNKVSKKNPVILVRNNVLPEEGTATFGDAEKNLAVIQPNHYQIARDIAGELKARYGNDLKGIKIGLVTGSPEEEATIDYKAGLKDALAGSDYEIMWELEKSTENGRTRSMVQIQTKVDVIICFRSDALEELGADDSKTYLKGASLYGIGNSAKCVSYLDEGLIKGLVMVDGYDMGYQAISEMSDRLESRFYSMKSHVVKSQIVKKEEIFTKDFEDFLYTFER